MSETMTRKQLEDHCDMLADPNVDWPGRQALAEAIQDHDAALRTQLQAQTERAEAAEARADRLYQDRYDLLEVTSTDGLSSCEWLMRTATAERKVKDLTSKMQERDAAILWQAYLTDALSKRNDLADQRKQQLAFMTQERDELKRQVAAMKDDWNLAEPYVQELRDLKQQLAFTMQERDESTEYYKLGCAERGKLNVEVEELGDQIEEVKQQLADRDAMIQELEKERDAAQIRYERQCEGTKTRMEQIASFHQQLTASEQRVRDLESTLDNYQKKYHDAKATSARLREALEGMRSEVADCVDELIEEVLYPMNEGLMNPVKMDICLAQLTQAVERIESNAITPPTAGEQEEAG